MAKCNCISCEVAAQHGFFIDGKPYCPEHYLLELQARFLESYRLWDGTESTIGRLKYNFSRYVGFVTNENFPNSLSIARIRDRGFNFFKSDSGLTFEIIRHPGAWKKGYGFEKIQKFEYNIISHEILLISETDTDTPFVS